MTINGVEPCKRFPATLANESVGIRVQLLMALEVMLPCEVLATPWRLAAEGFFITMRAQMP